MTILGDLAEKVATEMGAEFIAPLNEPLPQDELAAERTSIFTKIRFAWGPQDKAILDRIRAAADAVFIELFADIITAIDQFYASMRVPEVNEHGIVRIGPDGRTVWKLDERGRPIEDISQLTGQDVDKAILDLQRLLLEVAPQVDLLMREAVYAHHAARDAHDDAWFGVVEGTQGDRTARSNRESRIERYHAYFRMCLHSSADSFLKEVNAFLKRLDNISYRLSRAQS